MDLLIVRHADAGDREDFAKTGQPDHLRPLSKKGHKQMQAAARGLLELVPNAGLIVTSPYTRAVETQHIVSAAYGDSVASEVTTTLEPEEAPEGFVRWMGERDPEGTTIAVGHEPHLSTLATWLMAGQPGSHLELKKAGACLLRFDDRVKKGRGTLAWLLTARQLQAVGRNS